jgi:hypothetical protein
VERHSAESAGAGQGRDRCRDRAMQPCARASVSVVLYFSINNMSERGLGGVEWIGLVCWRGKRGKRMSFLRIEKKRDQLE